MSRGDLAQSERGALCDLLLEVGPDHPTLCEGWTSSHLAAHLVTRERNPLVGPGIVIGGPFARYTARALEKARTSTPYPDLVARVRGGPPAVLRRVDGAMNLVEFFVHHEDVRRGARGWQPRSGLDELDAALWQMQGRATKFQTRRLRDVALALERPDGERKAIGTTGLPVTLRGAPSEIVLFLFGRRGAAQVELSGHPDGIEALQTVKLGI